MTDHYPRRSAELAPLWTQVQLSSAGAPDITTPRDSDGNPLSDIQTMSPQGAAYLLSRESPTTEYSSAFLRLPLVVIQRILWTVDANSFASLCVLTRAWHDASQDAELYAYHLSRCPSYALSNGVISGPFRRNDLYRLKAKFAIEVRRNLFDAFTRPRQTLLNLISATTSSSAAFPQGEAFRFAFSPNGQTVLALSSSRIYVLDVASDPVCVRKELTTLRKPLAASITDDGTLLAVLSSKHQANIYNLSSERLIHQQVLVLDNPPRTIALAHEGTVLAAAYETGIEVFSLAANALSTDRRAVRSEPVDTLMFSGDGSMLVGSSQNLEDPNAVVITAPFYHENDPDVSAHAVHSRMWTTQILFPQISSVASHVELLQDHMEGDASWLFAYDHSLMSYRAVRTDDTRTGVAYFLSPASARRFSMPTPSIPPSATACGTLVVAGFTGTGLSLYGIPERLDVSPDMGAVVEKHEQDMRGPVALTTATGNMEPLMAYSPSISGDSYDIDDDSIASKVDWRQSIFVKCCQIATLDGFTAAKWVEHLNDRRGYFADKRLVVVAPGGVQEMDDEMGDESVPVDGSRICLLDFGYGPSNALDRELTIRVGEGKTEILTEQSGNMDVEVAMERRRTVRNVNRTAQSSGLQRSATAALPSSPGVFDTPHHVPGPASPMSPYSGERHNVGSANNLLTAPSATTPAALHRAHTAASYSNARYPPRPPLGSGASPIWNQSGQEPWESPPPPYPPRFNGPTPPPPVIPSALGEPFQSSQAQSGPQPPTIRIPGTFKPLHQSLTDDPRAGAVQDSPHTVTNIIPTPLRHHFTEPVPPTPSTIQSPPRAGTHPVATVTVHSSPTQVIGNSWTSFLNRQNSGPSSNLPTTDENRQAKIKPYLATSTPPSQILSNLTDPNQPLVSSGKSTRQPVVQTLGSTQKPVQAVGNLSGQSPRTDQQQHPPPALITASPVTHSPTRLTLTGNNLRNRLNHPVPPTPEGFASYDSPSRAQQEWPPPEQIQVQSQTTTPVDMPRPQSSTVQPAPGDSPLFELVPPTADQIANLNRRLSQTRPQPRSIAAKDYYGISTTSAVQDFGRVSPSPHMAAWGAVGVSSSPSSNRIINSSNGIHRSLSGTSNRSLGGSSSTPNLHFPQRPPYGRLDTIESVGSVAIPGDRPHSMQRPHSMVPDIGAYTATAAAMHNAGLEENKQAGSRGFLSEDRSKKKKRGKAASLPALGEFGQDATQSQKKSSRCSVM